MNAHSLSDERRRVEIDRAEAAEAYDRQIRRELAALLIICWGWVLLGVWLLGSALHTGDETVGRSYFALALGVGNGGIYFTILAWYVRRSERGDFD